jgi:hypothetical protein
LTEQSKKVIPKIKMSLLNIRRDLFCRAKKHERIIRKRTIMLRTSTLPANMIKAKARAADKVCIGFFTLFNKPNINHGTNAIVSHSKCPSAKCNENMELSIYTNAAKYEEIPLSLKCLDR